MANFNLFGQTITDVNGFSVADTNGNDHTFIETLLNVQISFTVAWNIDHDTVLSVTCNKTLEEIQEMDLELKDNAVVYFSDQFDVYEKFIAKIDNLNFDESVSYIAFTNKPFCEVILYANGTCTYSATPSSVTTLTATANGTYRDSQNRLYSEVTVNVPGGGTNSWTKVAETRFRVRTTSTSVETVATWETGDSSIWTSDKWVYVRTRDTEGKRNGYFYGTDTFFYNVNPINDEAQTSVTSAIRITKRYKDDLVYTTATTGPTGYGVYPDTIYNNGDIRIQKHYNSNISFTVNGTYKVEVYLLDPAGGVPIFE